jgi:hypothetical protein
MRAAGIRRYSAPVEFFELPGPAVTSGGRLATITSDPPDAERGIEIRQVYVAPDGPRLARLGELLAAGTIGVAVGTPFPLEHAAQR